LEGDVLKISGLEKNFKGEGGGGTEGTWAAAVKRREGEKWGKQDWTHFTRNSYRGFNFAEGWLWGPPFVNYKKTEKAGGNLDIR